MGVIYLCFFWTGIPAVLGIIEWILTGYGDRSGRNDVRTLTGVALGVGYGFGLAGLLIGRNRLGIVGIGLGYAAIAGGLLWTETR